ncbi:hypothetical protein DBR44_03440 [Aquitalea sp. FJL05]|uniref:hypothetical protein n=1 Tax=Aquitalea TaxID=407217 RepID=UPI000F593880|nr:MULTISPECIES: hypothetical protein [Aquitalea]RQO77259.1 hypothetical protein DBR44_03440 [Aquitalea sp. FJL05]
MMKELCFVFLLFFGYAFLVNKSITLASNNFTNRALQFIAVVIALVIALTAILMLGYAFFWVKTPPVRPKSVLIIFAENVQLPIFLFFPTSLAFITAFVLRKKEKYTRQYWVQVITIFAAIFSPIGLVVSGSALAGTWF